jgi:drug/metabolite transporter (DMT)-like permease
MILVNNPDFVVTAGKQYAIFAAMTIVTPLSALGVGHRVNRRIEQGLMVLSFAGVIVIVCTVLATASPRASAVSPTPLCVCSADARNSCSAA